MRVKEIAGATGGDVRTTPPDTTVGAACSEMRQRDIGAWLKVWGSHPRPRLITMRWISDVPS